MPAKYFIEEVLISRLNISHLILGPDAAVGRNREGNVDFIKEVFKGHGRTVAIEGFLDFGNLKISSRRIREMLRAGSLDQAKAMLGYPYTIAGRVGKGDQVGRTLGFPTANISVKNYVTPPLGAYACWVKLKQKTYPAVCNIGVRPTVVDNDSIKLEVFLFDYSGADFYGNRIEVALNQFVSAEQKLGSLSELKIKMASDSERARKILLNNE